MPMYFVESSTNEITHHGVKGMKWGIRRNRRSKAASKRSKKVKRSRAKDTKNRRLLSNEELKKRIDRLELEKKYKQLSDEDLHPGRTMVRNFLQSVGGKVVTSAAIGSLAYAGKVAISKKPNLDEAANYIFPNPNKKK